MIALQEITVHYPDSTPLLDVSLDLGSVPTVVTGPSGSGKSTLLRVIAGLQRADAGTVVVNGASVSEPSWRSAGDARVALIHQDYRLVGFLSIEENLRLAAEMRGMDLTRNDVMQSLAAVGMEAIPLGRRPATLSGGEQQRIAIARALVCNVEVLLADEPTGALDIDNTRRVAEILAAIGERSGVDVVVATHDPVVVAVFGTQLVLRNGELCAA